MNDARSRPAVEPFAGLPDLPALVELRGFSRWVAWDLRWREDRQAWIKLPIDPRTGRNASTTDPATWSTYGAAAYRARRHDLAGVGFVLTGDDDLTGIDLDKVREPVTGELVPWAAERVATAETYCEISPSGTGVRMFARGKVETSVASKPASVEIYRDGRYLTVTGRHLPGTPVEIRAAPTTLAALLGRVADLRPMDALRQPGTARSSGRDETFWRRVNGLALDHMDAWVREVFPHARRKPQGYRITSRDLGRDLEEDLLIYRRGIKDCGVWDLGDPREGRRTPIDLVVEHRGVSAEEAAHWLCSRIGVDPEALGWGIGGAGARFASEPTFPDGTVPVEEARAAARAAIGRFFVEAGWLRPDG